MAPEGRNQDDRAAGPALERWLGRVGESTLIWILLGIALILHGYNMFGYPPYLGDEGIYMEQAWAVLRQGRLTPYTYFYDHAPVGWLMIAGWVLLLPGKFLAFGMSINSGRAFMLLVHLASVVLMYKVTRRMSGSHVASVLTVVVFSLSPLGLYYQRMVLLDNIMVLWLLLSMYLILYDGNRLVTVIGAGAAFGLATLSKENAIFFAPVLAYMSYHSVRGTHRFRFAFAGWVVAATLVVSFYPLYALLKSELFPEGTLALLGGQPADHVSLINTLLWQMSRAGGSILDPGSQFWLYFWDKWWPKDGVIIAAGVGGALVNLIIWRIDPERHRSYLVAALMALAFGFYLARGSIMIEFYVVPILPFLGLNVGMAVAFVLDHLPGPLALVAFVLILGALFAAFLYVGRDAFRLNLTALQGQQLAWIRQNLPPRAIVIVDDDLWVDLREPGPGHPAFPNAHSHWKVQGDPEIRTELLKDDYKNADYIVVSDDMRVALERNNSDFVIAALDDSTLLKAFDAGEVHLEVREINRR